ncbi:MAG: twin-arginine translocase TatA/TatE family subunit [bacterium]|nr:twin-arginine translocase TatA/TatE family subunit [bacterium]
MFGTLGMFEILLIVLAVALLFGGKKLGQLGKGLGEGITNFKDALKTGADDSSKENNDTDNATGN